MQIGPVFRALRQSKFGALLVAFQIACAMTVAVNSRSIVREIQLLDRPSGLPEAELFHISTRGFAPGFNAKTSVLDDLALLRRTPGVVNATVVNTVPLSGSGQTTGLQLVPGHDQAAIGAAVYMVDEQGVATFGVELIAGRDFTPEDVRERGPGVSDWPDTAILSAATARLLWPDASVDDVVGRVVYTSGDKPMTVVGVVAVLVALWPVVANPSHTMLVPDKRMEDDVRYLVRAAPGRLGELMPLIEEQLAHANRGRIVRAPRSMSETRAQGLLVVNGIATILIVVTVALLSVTALGIAGLAAYSVRRRTKQIGTRRALGARKRDILGYFLTENFLISSVGVAFGAVLTVAFNVALVQNIPDMPKLQWHSVLLGAIAMWLVGLLAVLAPARRASDVPPAVATRTV